MMAQNDKESLTGLLNQYRDLGIAEQIDFNKFYLYSIIANSTAIEGSTMTEEEAQLLFDEGITGGSMTQLHIEHLRNDIDKFLKTTEEVVDSDRRENTVQKDVADDVAVRLTERQRIIIELIENHVAQNVAVNTKYLAEKLNVNRKTIQRDAAFLQERKLIGWVGADKTGHWEIIKENRLWD